MRKILIVAFIFVLLFSCASIAFAAGERADFYGTYSIGFTSGQSVPQMNDRTVQVFNDETYYTRGSDGIPAVAAMKVVNSSGTHVGDAIPLLMQGQKFYIHVSTHPTIRNLHIRLDNYNGENTTIYTRGHAILHKDYLSNY